MEDEGIDKRPKKITLNRSNSVTNNGLMVMLQIQMMVFISFHFILFVELSLSRQSREEKREKRNNFSRTQKENFRSIAICRRGKQARHVHGMPLDLNISPSPP